MPMLYNNSRAVEDSAEDRFYEGIVEAMFDVNLLRSAYEEVKARVEPMVGDRSGDPLTCISLTHRPDATDRLADESQFAPEGTLRYLERELCCFNEDFADTYFAVVHQAMSAVLPVGRMRLMIVRPGRVYRMHADATKRAHLAIHTDPEAFLVGPTGRGHHVPVDGRVRVFDTRLRHTAFNAGSAERVHVVMSVADTERAHHLALLPSKAGA